MTWIENLGAKLKLQAGPFILEGEVWPDVQSDSFRLYFDENTFVTLQLREWVVI